MVKKLLLVSVVLAMVALVSSTALALDPMGPPTAGYKTGQIGTSLEYTYSNMDLDLKNFKNTWTESTDGVVTDSGWEKYKSTELENFKQNKVYANIGYGLADNWEVFIRLGGADAKTSYEQTPTAEYDNEEGDIYTRPPPPYTAVDTRTNEIDNSMDFAYGFGTKVTFYQQEQLDLGALFQMSFVDYETTLGTKGVWDDSGTLRPWKNTGTASVSLTEMQIALGATFKPSPTLSIYGGPFFALVDGKMESTGEETSTYSTTAGEPAVTTLHTDKDKDKTSADISEKGCFGGYFGVKGNLTENTHLLAEFQFTGDAMAFATGLGWKF
jgi:hypothetical protein